MIFNWVLVPIFVFPIAVAFLMRRKGQAVAEGRLTEPHCAKCGYDLRRYSAEPPTRCSECGADLTARHAVRWGELSQQRGLRGWPLAAALIFPLLMFAFTFLLLSRARLGRPAAFVGPAGLTPGGGATNQALLTSLAKTVQQPWDWQELDRRLLNGTLSNTEAASAIELLIAELNKQANWNPLTWSEPFVTHAIHSGAISNAQYLRLAQAFYRTAHVTMSAKVRQGKMLPFTIEYGGFWQLPGVALLKALRPVTLADGTAIRTSSFTDPNNSRGTPNLDYLSCSGNQNIGGDLKAALPPGRYVANFVLDAGECVLLSGLPNVGDMPGQAAHWPTVRAKWTEQVTMPFEVVPEDQSPVELVTDPTLDPRRNGLVGVRTLRAIHFGSGQRIVAEVSVDGRSVSCCFDMVARVSGKEYSLGSLFASHITSTMSGKCDLNSLPAEIRSIDLVLTPNARRAEGVIGMDRIWGGTIELLNQPLQRYDLDASTTQQ